MTAAGTWRDLVQALVRVSCLAGHVPGCKSTKKEHFGLWLVTLPWLLSDSSAWGAWFQLGRVCRHWEGLGWGAGGDPLPTELLPAPHPAPSSPDGPPHLPDLAMPLQTGWEGDSVSCVTAAGVMGGAGLSLPGQMQDQSRQGLLAGSALTAGPPARGNLPIVQHAGALQGSSWLLRHL